MHSYNLNRVENVAGVSASDDDLQIFGGSTGNAASLLAVTLCRCENTNQTNLQEFKVTQISQIAQKYLVSSSRFKFQVSQKAQRAQKNDLDVNLKRKAERIVKFILEVGNFGHNRDMSFYKEGSYLGQKVRSFGRRMGDLWNHLMIFPMDTLRFFPRIMWNGVVSAVRGE